jgi:hypothetical protein
MNERDRIRIIKLEDEIQDTREKLQQELQFEEASGRKTLLMSRVYAKKLEQLLHRKTNIDKSLRTYRDKRSSYDLVLKQRMDAVRAAENGINDVEITIAQLIATHAVSQLTTFNDNLTIYKKLLRSKKVILANKQRALNNWLDRNVSDTDVIRVSHARNANSMQIQTSAIQSHLQPKDILGNDPRWDGKAENNASLDLLNQFRDSKEEDVKAYSSGSGVIEEVNEEEFVEENPFALNEPHKKIEI